MDYNNNIRIDIQDRLNFAIEKIKKQYLNDDKNLPWLIGYSGGKDSTVTAQLVFQALIELKKEKKKLNRKITIFSSDTMIENPLVKEIIQENIKLINIKANKLGLPIEALILKPTISKTFWVNVIGKGYPTPNTMFRWCTDRLKIDPANNFIHEYIDKNGEVVMVLGVREGESNTRDRVLKTHEIEGEVLMKHTTLTNAYIFAPIKHLNTVDVFTYLSGYDSPWDSNNIKLYMFYEESGGGDCQIFLSEKEKTSSNSCGNSRMGCWVCTVVSKDKSLSGFIQTGFYDYLIPLLDFRNWLVSIRDDYKYRCHYRNNGSIYKKPIKMVEKDGVRQLIIPKKGDRDKIVININTDGRLFDSEKKEYLVIDDDKLNDYLKKNRLDYNSPVLEYLIIKDHITNEYCRLGSGPYTDNAKKLIIKKLLEAEKSFNSFLDNKVQLITDGEIVEIKKLWLASGLSTSYIDELLLENGRKVIFSQKNSFEIVSEKYEKPLKKHLVKENLDYGIVKQLLHLEKKFLSKENRKEMQDEIAKIFGSDKMNI